MAVLSIAAALAEDMKACHEYGGPRTRARAPGRLGRHSLHVVLPSVAVSSEGLCDSPIDLAICRAEEGDGGSGNGEVVQEFGTTGGDARFDRFAPAAVGRSVGPLFEVGNCGVEDGGTLDAGLGSRIRPFVPNDPRVTG